MSGEDTRLQILSTSLTLFNSHGYGSVTMKLIADKLGVDRRNISYHFDKEGLLSKLTEEMWREQEAYRNLKRDFPSFENLDKEVMLYDTLQQKYAFVFNDLYVINHSLVHERFKSFCATIISDCEQAVAFAIDQGNMNKEPVSGTYRSLCESVLAISLCRPHLRSLRQLAGPDHIRKMIWAQIVPYFTPKGVQAFQTFFGEDFYHQLGPQFDIKVQTILF